MCGGGGKKVGLVPVLVVKHARGNRGKERVTDGEMRDVEFQLKDKRLEYFSACYLVGRRGFRFVRFATGNVPEQIKSRSFPFDCLMVNGWDASARAKELNRNEKGVG